MRIARDNTAKRLPENPTDPQIPPTRRKGSAAAEEAIMAG
jgi:hypothetical protein